MGTADLLEQLTRLSDAERLEVIAAATQLIRNNFAAGTTDAAADSNRRMRAAAANVRDLYEGGTELTEWTALDAEDFVDEHPHR
ncbi:MAG: hypothetical protein GXY83_44440 [Rhodopirellula sp.]|nr:hypothetical protein [Rhodopirellula sp.]